ILAASAGRLANLVRHQPDPAGQLAAVARLTEFPLRSDLSVPSGNRPETLLPIEPIGSIGATGHRAKGPRLMPARSFPVAERAPQFQGFGGKGEASRLASCLTRRP